MSKTSPAAAPTRQRRKEARPQELLDAALELFVEKGFAATRSDEVAVRAGVSKGTLYLYYPSKEELLKAVIQQNLSGVIAEGAGIVDQFEGQSAELLAMLMRMWWVRVGNSPAGGIHKIMMSEVRNFPEIAQFYRDEVIQPAADLLIRTLRRGVERGEFRPLPYEETVHALIAPLIFMSLHKNSFGACPAEGMDFDPDRVIDVHIELMLHGLLAKPDTTTKTG
ncbi:TetR/AcrR family transcriptional regulator [Piscinibacter sp. HJYY11]|uniref:TetR/AcrR family transcriptional regulator n=1 Tax=Piscinibacter sp. HJYY11 TaxID=2801333 RepID=UPI00191D3016|nr:TetR/AcrR family transcriptional regulator [Piscinibacter sp. HJYY11]MBL0727137.1 TetR/AcrR family transcriptional regulator [Piscinibacter sp. HJYY11]